jgi:PA domain
VHGSYLIAPVSQAHEFDTFRFFFGKHLTAELTGEAVSIDRAAICNNPGGIGNVQGKIVFVEWGTCRASTKARTAQNAGAIAVVQHVKVSVPGFESYWDHDLDADDITIPVFTASNAAYQLANRLAAFTFPLPSPNQNSTNLVTLSPNTNPWQTIVEGGWWIWFQVFNSAFSFINFALASRKLATIIRNRGFALTIPVFALGMEIFSNGLRGIVTAINPLNCYLLMPRTLNIVMFTITVPLNMITTLILAFFFYELTSNTRLSKVSFLARPSSKIGAAALALTLLGLELFLSVNRAQFRLGDMYIVHNVVMTILMVGVSGVFMHNTWNVRKFLDRQGGASSGKNSINRLTHNVFMAAVLMLLEVLFRLLAVFIRQPAAVYCFAFGGFACANSKSFFQILAFAVQSKKKELDVERSYQPASTASPRNRKGRAASANVPMRSKRKSTSDAPSRDSVSSVRRARIAALSARRNAKSASICVSNLSQVRAGTSKPPILAPIPMSSWGKDSCASSGGGGSTDGGGGDVSASANGGGYLMGTAESDADSTVAYSAAATARARCGAGSLVLPAGAIDVDTSHVIAEERIHRTSEVFHAPSISITIPVTDADNMSSRSSVVSGRSSVVSGSGAIVASAAAAAAAGIHAPIPILYALPDDARQNSFDEQELQLQQQLDQVANTGLTAHDIGSQPGVAASAGMIPTMPQGKLNANHSRNN